MSIFLKELFSPFRIGKLELKNRTVMAPMFMMYGDENSFVTDQICNYYAERAKGGVGLIIVENITVARGGEQSPREMSADDDKYIPGLRRLVDTIHINGAKAAVQINHVGRQRNRNLGQAVAPSPIPCKVMKNPPRELNVDEIEHLVEEYALAAYRSKQAGFDAVELHCAHGYLVCEFLSPYTNKRTDQYGGPLTNRMRFAIEIVRRIRQKVGPDYPLFARISGSEFIEGGLGIDETKIIARKLQDEGVNCIDVSAGMYETGGLWTVQPSWQPRGCLLPLAEEIKKEVAVPVIVAGRICDPVLANDIIKKGQADLIGLGRPLIADAHWVNKARSGDLEDIRMCIACCHCIDTLLAGNPVNCAINPLVGKEDMPLATAGKPKKVLVVGGGPGGMEAAAVAATRGHKVTIYEEGHSLGGQLILAAIPPGKEELNTLTEYYVSQLKKLGVDIKLGQRISAEQIVLSNPDEVIIAAGSFTSVPDIPGASFSNVVLARDVISGSVNTGKKVVVVGGGRVGCEAAEVLEKHGKEVTLIRMSGKSRLAGELGVMSRAAFLDKLMHSKISIRASTNLESIRENGVFVNDTGQSKFIEADTVVLSPRPIVENNLANELRGKIKDIHLVGDCVAPRRIIDAVHEGFTVGCAI